MRYGHSPDGIIGITLKPSTFKRWALGLHICTQLRKDVAAMVSRDVDTVSQGRRSIMDRTKIQGKQSACIHPLNTKHHPEGLTNISTGRIYLQKVNETFAEGWPQSFHKPRTKPVEPICSKIVLGSVHA